MLVGYKPKNPAFLKRGFFIVYRSLVIVIGCLVQARLLRRRQ